MHSDHDSAQAPRAPVSAIDDVDRIAPVVEDSNRASRNANPNVDTDDSSHASQQLVSSTNQDNTSAKEPIFPLLRYRRTSVWLLACYLPFLILPWILICIMEDRPPNLPSYYNQRGEYCEGTYTTILFWFAFVRILNSIASILTVPITSALLAQGAVVYIQRRKAGQKLNLRQTFALSDRGWSDIPILWGAYRENGTASTYLQLAACLLLLSAVQAPIQQAMIKYDIILIMTCADLPSDNQPVLGYDPEPAALAVTPQIMVVPDLIKSLATVTDMDMQPYLWHDTTTDWSEIQDSGDDNEFGSTFFIPYDFNEKLRYFVSALPNTTSTGVLREHVMRLNSSANCNAINEATFPDPCGGPEPFLASYSSQVKPSFDNATGYAYGYGNFSIDVCVPGNVSASPWTLSRDPQTIDEDLYIKVHVDDTLLNAWGSVGEGTLPFSFTVHCTANTTRGYFELPNFRNGFIAGPLLQKWPDNETLFNDYNDYLFNFNLIQGIPSTIDNSSVSDPSLAGDWRYPIDPFDRFQRPTPGPLMTSVLAIFGKDSFFYVASNSSALTYPAVTSQICQAGNIPFLRLDGFGNEIYRTLFAACSEINDNYDFLNGYSRLDPMLYEWISTFYPQDVGASESPHTYSREALEVAMFFANQHWLTETATATKLLYSARNIYTSPGTVIPRPVVPLYGKITVSILIALQLFGLGRLMMYIYSVPTWTEKFDSFAIAQLTHDVDSGVFSRIKKPSENDLERLKDCNGLVGVAEENDEDKAGSILSRHEAAPEEQEVDPNVQEAGADEDATAAASSHSNKEGSRVDVVATEVDEDVRLVRGGTGFVTRKHASFEEWKPKFKAFRRRKATKESTLEKGHD